MSELWRMDAARLTEGYARHEFTPAEVLEACFARVAETKQLNAVVLEDRMGAKLAASASRMRWARGKPLGPLDGVPVSLKDNLHAAGLPTTWGSRLLKNFVARKDELPVQRLRSAGAVVFSKTNLPEFAMQGYTANDVFGITRNPWNPQLTPGGSSGGAAAAVASGCGPIALATDGGGSIRRPASYCGLVGFKPSAGRVARDFGLPEILLDFEVVGGIAHTVIDAHNLVEAAAGEVHAPLADAPAARILHVPRFGDKPVEPAIAERIAQAARQLQALGHAVEEAASFNLADRVNAGWPVLSGAGAAWMLSEAGTLAEFGLHPGETPDIGQCTATLQEGLRGALEADAATLFDVFAAVHELKRKLAELFTRHDFLLTPVAAAMPWPAEQAYPPLIAGREVEPRGHAVFTAFANAAGLPAVSLPCGLVDGLPVGLQLVGRPGADAALMALAAQYERAYPWKDLRAP